MFVFDWKSHHEARIRICYRIIVLCLHTDSAERHHQIDPAQTTNLVILIANDMGCSDIGAFGSEIRTPNIDQLAESGADNRGDMPCAPMYKRVPRAEADPQ